MPRRVLAVAVGATLVLAGAGAAWEVMRFGWNQEDASAHLHREVTQRVTDGINVVTTTAQRVARAGDLVAAATASRERLPDLFARLSDPGAAGSNAVTATVWVPAGPGHEFRALAWTDGPAEDIPPSYLDRAPAVFVTSGASGVRLVSVQPVEHAGRPVGVAAAETQLSAPATAGALVPQHYIDSWAGPLPVNALDGGLPAADSGSFVVTSPGGVPLLAVRLSVQQVIAARRTFRWRVVMSLLVPWAAVLLMAVSRMLARRRTATAAGWMRWTAAACAALVSAALAASWLLRQAAVHQAWNTALAAATLMAIAAIGTGDAWRRTRPLRRGGRGPARFAFEHALGGIALSAGVATTAWLWRTRVAAVSIEQWHLPVLSASVATSVALLWVLAAQIAVAWAAAAMLGVLGTRWRLSWRTGEAWIAAGLWVAPSGALATVVPEGGGGLLLDVLVMAASATAFGLSAGALRRRYRRGSEARRILLQYAALLLPVLATYPLAASSADRTMRLVIEREYAPATAAAQQPDRLMDNLTGAWADIDAFTELPDLLREAGSSVNSTQLAFRAWNRTLLSRERITSQLELYGPSRTLVSRFSLNLPELGSLAQSGERTWPGTGCEWDAFAEVARFGAGERRMLHAERALCGGAGEFLGAVVIRIMPDYRTLPFVASTSPYYDALGASAPQSAGLRVPELQVVVYGWSLQPVFVSGRVVWPIDAELAAYVISAYS